MYLMYLIKEFDKKIQVSCKSCADKGYISSNCHSCNGKGIHNKTIKVWGMRLRPLQINKIDRASKDEFYRGTIQTQYKDGLRYWTDLSCFYNEHDKLVHFTMKDALRECNQRNIEKYGEDFCKQYLKRSESEKNINER